MLRNHLLVAMRSLLRNRVYSAINITGLALALTCFTFIFLYVEHELSFDRFHRNPENIFRIVKHFVNEEGTRIPDAMTPPALAPALRQELPEVAYSTRLFPNRGRLYLLEHGDRRFYETEVIRVDSNFFDVFDFPIVSGDKRGSLRDVHSIVLTESTARKYFGEETPMNKVIRMNLNNGTDYVVSGVVKDPPLNSHFTFDVLIPFESGRNPDTDWMWSGFYTYVRLKQGSDARRFESNVRALYKKHRPNSLDEYYTQSLPAIHLTSKLKWELGVNGDTLNVRIMIVIGLFVLLIATFNYVNIVTAQATRRSKEVGVRKVTGATRFMLVGQFVVESMLVAGIALGLSVIMTSLAIPHTQAVIDYDLSALLTASRYIDIALPATAIAIGLLAGIIPALYLSSFEPLNVLKFRFLIPRGGIKLRQGLVVFQFAISTGLMIGSVVIISQLDFIRQRKLGFDKENILLLPNVRGGVGNSTHRGDMIGEMKTIAGVNRIARADGILGYNNSVNGIGTRDGETHVVLNFIRADYDFLPVMGIALKHGRNFSEAFQSDNDAVILNETALKQLGLPEPYPGQQLVWDDGDGKTRNVTLIGVVEDFHFGSFREAIKPFGFVLEVGNGSTFFLKLQSGDIGHTLAQIRDVWTKHYPGRPFEYSFQDDEFTKLHVSEAKFKKLFTLFTALALFIACMGMFGLITYLAETKTKEIGIRKVLGAPLSAIVILLSMDFVKMVIVALALSGPLAFVLMQRWLDGFAYRTHMDWKVFAFTGIASVVIAFITTGFQSLKAARANPVRSLRSE